MVFAALTPMLVVLVRNSVTDVFARSIFMTFPLIICMLVCSKPPKGFLQRLRRRRSARSPQAAVSRAG
jgi:hypothetical protein